MRLDFATWLGEQMLEYSDIPSTNQELDDDAVGLEMSIRPATHGFYPRCRLGGFKSIFFFDWRESSQV